MSWNISGIFSEDRETDLIYMGARWYDPVLGRFMGIDPVGVDLSNVHSFNRYAYANNNPYAFVDPDGRAAETVSDVVSLGLSISIFASEPSFWNGVGVLCDGLATAVPFLPAGFGIIKSADKVVDVTKGPKFAIDDGVRRAKSADLLGNKTIPARIKQSGKPDVFQDVPVSSLRSPKSEIPADSRFFDRNFNPAKNGSTPPPIEIRQISSESPGLVPIRNVDLIP